VRAAPTDRVRRTNAGGVVLDTASLVQLTNTADGCSENVIEQAPHVIVVIVVIVVIAVTVHMARLMDGSKIV
jgi:hypothetical protein